MTTPRTVSVLGLGLMGSALAEALLAAGHLVTVWNRTTAKAGPLTAQGARAAASATDAVAASDVSILCVIDHAATMEVLAGVSSGEAASEICLVQLSTMKPAESQEIARWATAYGLRYLEGSILGVPGNVTAGTATIIASGPRDVFRAVEPVLQAFGGGKHLSDEYGAAVSFDRVYYAFTYGVQMAFLQGAALAHARGFSIETYTDIVMARIDSLKSGFGQMSSNIAARDHRLRECRADVWAAAFAETLALCRETKIDATLPAAITRLFERNSAAGRGGDELSSIFETLIEETGG